MSERGEKLHPWLAGASALAMLYGCHDTTGRDDTPQMRIVRDIERGFVGHPCIGDINRWHRSYRFHDSKATISPDADTVLFLYRQGDTKEYRPGVYFFQSSDSIKLDHRQFKTAGGEYSITKNRIVLRSCGNNIKQANTAKPTAGSSTATTAAR